MIEDNLDTFFFSGKSFYDLENWQDLPSNEIFFPLLKVNDFSLAFVCSAV